MQPLKYTSTLSFLLVFMLVLFSPGFSQTSKPNILFCIADDWGWPHAGVYGDKVIRTSTFDRLSKEGLLFEQAFVSSPSCTPSRGAILSGQQFYRLGEGANLWSTLDKNIPVFPLLLQEAGYFIGSWRKAWGPGDLTAGGYTNTAPSGKEYQGGFPEFIKSKPSGQPFCFWLGSSDPHRPYEKGIGKSSGIDVDQIKVPSFYPEADEIKSDIADYYWEVQRFNRDVAAALKVLDSIGALENTIVVVTGDHGMPFPRCKANLYDMGSRVPLVISWPKKIKKAQAFNGMVSLTDLAPTFLEAAGVKIPRAMTGKSLMPVINSKNVQKQENRWTQVVYGRERHTPAQESPSINGYPCRAIRTNDYLLIKNYTPERWPAGVPANATHAIGSFADCDDGPTKSFLIKHKNDTAIHRYYEMAFSKRPAIELYQISTDPYQINNIADDPQYEKIKEQLLKRLDTALQKTGDPRILQDDPPFDKYPFRQE